MKRFLQNMTSKCFGVQLLKLFFISLIALPFLVPPGFMAQRDGNNGGIEFALCPSAFTQTEVIALSGVALSQKTLHSHHSHHFPPNESEIAASELDHSSHQAGISREACLLAAPCHFIDESAKAFEPIRNTGSFFVFKPRFLLRSEAFLTPFVRGPPARS